MTAIPSPPTLRLADPSALVAALPVVLGFRPRESLVLAALCADGAPGAQRADGALRLGLTVRVDLPPRRAVAAVCGAAAENLLRGDPAAAAVVVVGGADARRARRSRGVAGAGARAAPGAVEPPRREVAAAAVEALGAWGVPALTVVWAATCAGGARWACYDTCGCAGFVPDPGGTALAAFAVAEGQVLYGDRAELEALVAPAGRAVLRRREALLVRAAEAVGAEVGAVLGTAAGAVLGTAAGADAAEVGAEAGAEPAVVGAEGAVTGAALAVVDRAVASAACGRLDLDDAAVVGLALALGTPAVRDHAMRLCAGPRAAAAEQLWAALARETPDPEAAVPAALLALSALLGGRGALANVALDRAERAWPGHRLTGLLRDAADAGVRPEEVRAWLQG